MSMKEVVNLIEKHVNERKIDRHQGLNVLLDFLVEMFDRNHFEKNNFIDNCKIQAKKEPCLYKVAMIWMDRVATAMESGGWIDFFGEIYEEMYQSNRKASTLGQFFTPPSVCDIMSELSVPVYGRINDSACGSGRTLLASASASRFSRSNVYFGEDIDIVSVKMCALNLMIHGCRGFVLQHDSIVEKEIFDFGFRINDICYPIQTPFYSLTKIKMTKKDLKKNTDKQMTQLNLFY